MRALALEIGGDVPVDVVVDAAPDRLWRDLQDMPRATLPGQKARGETGDVMGDADGSLIHVVRPVGQVVAHGMGLFPVAPRVHIYRSCISARADVQCPPSMKGSTVFLVFLGLAVAAMGGLFTALMWGSYQRAANQRSWPRVEAVVLSSEVEEYQHDEFSPKEYRLEILYGYEWEGEAMTGEKLTARGSSPSKDRAKIAGEAKDFPAGAKVTAYVNPADPASAILKPDSKAAGYSIWFPLLFVVGGLGIVVRAVRAWKRR